MHVRAGKIMIEAIVHILDVIKKIFSYRELCIIFPPYVGQPNIITFFVQSKLHCSRGHKHVHRIGSGERIKEKLSSMYENGPLPFLFLKKHSSF